MNSDSRQIIFENAIQFLQDPQVRASKIERQLDFLRNKGLTDAEIEEAMKRAAVIQDNNNNNDNKIPPLPITEPPKRTLQHSPIDWGKFAIILGLIGSAGMVLSQSTLMKSFLNFLRRIKSKLFASENTIAIDSDIQDLRQDQTILKKTLSGIEQSFKKDLEGIKTTQNYLYNELSRDLEEIRDEIKMKLNPIQVNNVGSIEEAVQKENQ